MAQDAGPRLGIYFNLDEDLYHEDDALGSTDVRLLVRGATEYWFASRMNPRRPRRQDTVHTIYGSAVHKLVLEGRQAFEAIYARRPDDLDGAGASDKAKTTRLHNDWCRENNMIGLHGDDYDRAMICSAMITLNPDLGDALVGGIPEVSMFWMEPIVDAGGVSHVVRCKARFDYLKPRGIGDIKNVSNPFKIDFVDCCLKTIAERRLDVQAELYLRGRARLPGLYALGQFDGDHDEALLERIANEREFGWQWIFYQATDAPLVFSGSLSPGNPILDEGRFDVDVALRRFVEARARFGEDMWAFAEPVREIDISELPPWFARRRQLVGG